MKFWMDDAEAEFLLSHINPKDSMLEWGSGGSTVALQNKVAYLMSIEHDAGWYEEVKKELKKKVDYFLIEPNNKDWERQYDKWGVKNPKGDDGSFEDFLDYVTFPVEYRTTTFDVIFIDGRARLSCAYMALQLSHIGTKIFIHDFGPGVSHPYLSHRTYYDDVRKFLTEVDHVKSLYMFKKPYNSLV